MDTVLVLLSLEIGSHTTLCDHDLLNFPLALCMPYAAATASPPCISCKPTPRPPSMSHLVKPTSPAVISTVSHSQSGLNTLDMPLESACSVSCMCRVAGASAAALLAGYVASHGTRLSLAVRRSAAAVDWLHAKEPRAARPVCGLLLERLAEVESEVSRHRQCGQSWMTSYCGGIADKHGIQLVSSTGGQRCSLRGLFEGGPRLGWWVAQFNRARAGAWPLC